MQHVIDSLTEREQDEDRANQDQLDVHVISARSSTIVIYHLEVSLTVDSTIAYFLGERCEPFGG